MNTLQSLYVSLDAILDLRLGVLNYLSPDFAFEVTTQPSYFEREEDIFSSDAISPVTHQPFGTLDRVAFNKLLTRLGAKVVPAAFQTRINRFVHQLCTMHWKNTMHEGVELSVEIDVNLAPYEFSDSTIATLHPVIQRFFGPHFKVNLINVPLPNLALERVRDTYFGMVFYEYASWVNGQDKGLRAKPLTNTCLYVPRLYFDGKPSAEHLEQWERQHVDPFVYMSRVLQPVLPIQYLPVPFFCAAIPQNLDSYTNPR